MFHILYFSCFRSQAKKTLTWLTCLAVLSLRFGFILCCHSQMAKCVLLFFTLTSYGRYFYLKWLSDLPKDSCWCSAVPTVGIKPHSHAWKAVTLSTTPNKNSPISYFSKMRGGSIWQRRLVNTRLTVPSIDNNAFSILKLGSILHLPLHKHTTADTVRMHICSINNCSLSVTAHVCCLNSNIPQ